MAEYIDREKLINDGIEKGFCDWYDEIKSAKKADVVERQNIDKAIDEINAAAYTEHIDGADCDDILIVELRDVLEILGKLIEGSDKE